MSVEKMTLEQFLSRVDVIKTDAQKKLEEIQTRAEVMALHMRLFGKRGELTNLLEKTFKTENEEEATLAKHRIKVLREEMQKVFTDRITSITATEEEDGKE